MTTRPAVKVPVVQISTPSTAITSDVVSVFDGGSLTLRFQFDRDGSLVWGGVEFKKVRAHQWRAESHCTEWHIEGAYDTVVELEDSPWVAELLMAEPAETWGRWIIRHFMLFIDGAGCFEVAAESVGVLPEETAG